MNQLPEVLTPGDVIIHLKKISAAKQSVDAEAENIEFMKITGFPDGSPKMIQARARLKEREEVFVRLSTLGP